MISEAELIVDRRRLRRKLTLWRIIAVLLAIAAIGALVWQAGGRKLENHLARITIEGLITGDQKTLDLLKEVNEADQVKGVILRIDSARRNHRGLGGDLSRRVREISAKKPVVAPSWTRWRRRAGYITAIGPPTGSWRAATPSQGPSASSSASPRSAKLLDTIGVKMEELKSGDLKAEPSPYKPVSDKVRAVSMEMVRDGYDWFTGLVAERRKLPVDAGPRTLRRPRLHRPPGHRGEAIDEIGGEEKARRLAPDREEARRPTCRWRTGSRSRAADPTGWAWRGERAAPQAWALKAWEMPWAQAKLDGLLVLWHPAQ